MSRREFDAFFGIEVQYGAKKNDLPVCRVVSLVQQRPALDVYQIIKKLLFRYGENSADRFVCTQICALTPLGPTFYPANLLASPLPNAALHSLMRRIVFINNGNKEGTDIYML